MSSTTSTPMAYQPRSGMRRVLKDRLFVVLCIGATSFSLITLAILLGSILVRGLTYLDWSFFRDVPSGKAAKAGIGPAMWGSIWVCIVCALTALPLGIGTAIFLEEFKPKIRWVRRLHGFLQLNITNLAGVPSIVYGILGLTVFVQLFGAMGSANSPPFEFGARWYDQFTSTTGDLFRVPVQGRDATETQLNVGSLWAKDAEGNRIEVQITPEMIAATPQRTADRSWYYFQLPLGRGVMAGGLTLMLVVLPIVIVASQEALRAVPDSLREGSLATGATRWQTVSRLTLPAAVPGIMTGSILAISRAIGEAAPMLVIAGVVYITFTPQHLMDEFTVMPLQIYNWASMPQAEFHKVAASGIIVLLAVLLTFNAVAVFIRQRFAKPLQ